MVSHTPDLLGVQNHGGMGSGRGVGSLKGCGKNDRFMQTKDRMKPILTDWGSRRLRNVRKFTLLIRAEPEAPPTEVREAVTLRPTERLCPGRTLGRTLILPALAVFLL